MAEKQMVDSKQDNRKTAPKINVAESYGKSPIDQLMADNPGESFVRVAEGCSKESLASRGLEPVMVGGEELTRRGYAIARSVGGQHEREIAAQFAGAEDTVSAVRDLSLSDSQAYAKVPKGQKTRPSQT